MDGIFNPKAAFSGCCICGAVFQSPTDRKVYAGYASPQEQVQATVARRNWSNYHATKMHTQKEHDQLAASGRFCTPEAAHKLAPYGIITLTDSFHEENRKAQEEAPRLPEREPESPTKGYVIPGESGPRAPDYPNIPRDYKDKRERNG